MQYINLHIYNVHVYLLAACSCVLNLNALCSEHGPTCTCTTYFISGISSAYIYIRTTQLLISMVHAHIIIIYTCTCRQFVCCLFVCFKCQCIMFRTCTCTTIYYLYYTFIHLRYNPPPSRCVYTHCTSHMFKYKITDSSAIHI